LIANRRRRASLIKNSDMENIQVVEASARDFETVSSLVQALLLELEPDAADEIRSMGIAQITDGLLKSSKISAFLALCGNQPIGVITLHECAAIYAGGVFGEISELYVKPEYRSLKVGALLLNSALEKGKALGWARLEVGSPPPNESPRTMQFYETNGFKCTGSRLRWLIA